MFGSGSSCCCPEAGFTRPYCDLKNAMKIVSSILDQTFVLKNDRSRKQEHLDKQLLHPLCVGCMPFGVIHRRACRLVELLAHVVFPLSSPGKSNRGTIEFVAKIMYLGDCSSLSIQIQRLGTDCWSNNKAACIMIYDGSHNPNEHNTVNTHAIFGVT